MAFNLITLLPSLIGLIKDPLKAYFDRRKEVRERAHELELTILENKSRLAADTELYNSKVALENLKGSGSPKVLQFGLLFILMIPYGVIAVAPELVFDYFEVLEASIPSWYHNLVISAIGIMFAIKEVKMFWRK